MVFSRRPSFRINKASSTSSPEESILIYYQNVWGLRTKLADFRISVLSSNYPIIVLTETWLDGSIHNGEFLDDRYVVYRSDRNSKTSSKKRGGGVLVAVMKSLTSYELKCKCCNEELWVRIKVGSVDLILCALYIPPSSDLDAYLSHLREVGRLMGEYGRSSFCLMGDYNLSGVRWVKSADSNILKPQCACNRVHYNVCDSLCYFNLVQYNGVVNHMDNILDLVLSNMTDLNVTIRLTPYLELTCIIHR